MNSQLPPCSRREENPQSDSCSPCASAEQNSQLDPRQDVCPSCPCGVTAIPTLPMDSGICREADPVKIPNPGEEIPNSGQKIPNSGEEIPNPGEEIPNSGEEIPNSGEEIPNSGEEIPNSGEEPFTIETPGMCVMKFPLQNSILAVEVCPFPPPREELENPKISGKNCQENLEKIPREEIGIPGICPEKICSENLEKFPREEFGVPRICLENMENLQEIPKSEPCSLEVVDLGTEEIPKDFCGISEDPCRSQGFGGSGIPKDCRSQNPPFRPNSCTSSVVERCLSRCQSWFRGKK